MDKSLNKVEQISLKKDSSLKNATNNYYYKDNLMDIKLALTEKGKKNIHFVLELNHKLGNESISGAAKLIEIEDESGMLIIPEGTAVLDKLTKEEYLCDSSFMYESNKITISFGLERKTANRLSLNLYNSSIDWLKDDDFTLVKR